MKFEPRLPEEGINVSRGNPLADAAKLVALVAGIVIAAAIALTLAVDRLVALVPPAVEMRAFRSLWPDVRRSMKPEEAARAGRVAAILNPLAARLEEPFEPLVLVVEDDAANAFALPGGVIGVTTGLLSAVRSENELAFVLGHELGHFVNRDHLRKLGRSVALSLLLAWIGGGSVDASGEQVAAMAGRMTSLAFDRRQESAADAVGLGLVAAEYGHVAGATEFFGRMEAGASRAERFAAYFGTHPAGRTRIGRMEALARRRGWSLEGALRPLAPEGAGEGR